MTHTGKSCCPTLPTYHRSPSLPPCAVKEPPIFTVFSPVLTQDYSVSFLALSSLREIISEMSLLIFLLQIQQTFLVLVGVQKALSAV